MTPHDYHPDRHPATTLTLTPHLTRRKTGAFSGLAHSPEKENGYRLRETDLRLKRPRPQQPDAAAQGLKTSNSNSSSNSASASRSPSPQAVAPVTYRELRQRGYRGTKYDAELLLAQGYTAAAPGEQQPFLDMATPASLTRATKEPR